jgi:hypothetical protein
MTIQLTPERMGQIALRHAEERAATHALQNGMRRPTEVELEDRAADFGERLNISADEALAYLKHINRY